MWYQNNVKWQLEKALQPLFKDESKDISKALFDGSYWTEDCDVKKLSFSQMLRATTELTYTFGRGNGNWTEKQVNDFNTILNRLEDELIKVYNRRAITPPTKHRYAV